MKHDYTFDISAFGDEISQQFDEQVDGIEQMGLDRIDLRGVGGTNIIDLDDAERERIRASLDERGISVSTIGSPIGKVDVTGGVEESATRAASGQRVDSFEDHLERFERAIAVADEFDADYLRVFSYYVPEGSDPSAHREEILRRMQRKVDIAAEADQILVHENVTDVYGESPARLRDLLTSIDSPYFRAIFDAANFYQYGSTPFPDALLQLVEYVETLHVKDARKLPDGTVEMTPLGEGDVDVPAIIRALRDRGFDGTLSLEPHLALDGPGGALSGREAVLREAETLQAILDDL
jgi:sugar phosphate isomerase/epimerase